MTEKTDDPKVLQQTPNGSLRPGLYRAATQPHPIFRVLEALGESKEGAGGYHHEAVLAVVPGEAKKQTNMTNGVTGEPQIVTVPCVTLLLVTGMQVGVPLQQGVEPEAVVERWAAERLAWDTRER